VSGVRIADVRTTIVNVPLVAPYVWAAGRYHGATKVIVEVETSDGVVGLGEAAHWRQAATIQEELRPRLLGADANDLNACRRRAVPPVGTLKNTDVPDVVRAYGAVEMALWDARGKALGVPLYELLGGAVRREIPFTEYFSARGRRGSHGGERTPVEVAAYCARMVRSSTRRGSRGRSATRAPRRTSPRRGRCGARSAPTACCGSTPTWAGG
jgi:glucarate dehydratase